MPLGEILPLIQDSIMSRTTYFGVPTLKNPMDAWIYQEIVFETKPDVIVEVGNRHGGSALYFAHLCDILGRGRIIGLDLSHKDVPNHVKRHPRITFIAGDACQNFEQVARSISRSDRVLVIEDSSHTYENTLNVLRLYSKLIKVGDYLIVEDSICHHGLATGPSPGPYEASEDFVRENADFQIDRERERFLITWNPKGYLKRVALSDQRSPEASAARPAPGPVVPGILTRVLRTLMGKNR
jgi:cephalosporin hydroxylase